MSRIIDAKWWTPPLNDIIFDAITGIGRNLSIGVVAVEISDEGDWKCYIGHGTTGDEQLDMQRIVEMGMPLGSAAAAHGFFPSRDIAKYRY